MNISVEISMYPFAGNYIDHIDSFLEKLHHIEGLKVQTNVMSTQVFGESSLVFKSLNQLVENVYKELDQCPFVIKVLNKDISSMEIKDY